MATTNKDFKVKNGLIVGSTITFSDGTTQNTAYSSSKTETLSNKTLASPTITVPADFYVPLASSSSTSVELSNMNRITLNSATFGSNSFNTSNLNTSPTDQSHIGSITLSDGSQSNGTYGIMSVISQTSSQLVISVSAMFGNFSGTFNVSIAGPGTETISSTEIGYLNGVTSGIQTQLNGKVDESLFDTKGDILVASADNTPVKLSVGTDGYILTSNSSATNGIEWLPVAAGGLPSQTGNEGKYLTTNGTVASWATVSGGGTPVDIIHSFAMIG